MRETLRLMDEENVVYGIVSGPLEVVEKWRLQSNGRLIASPMFFDPHVDGVSLEELRAGYASKRLGALGELGLQYAGLTPGDPSLDAYFALAEEFDVPVAIHTGDTAPNAASWCCPKYRITLGKPELVEEVLVRHPRLRVYLMHAGGPWTESLLALMGQYPQVYIDMANLGWGNPPAVFRNRLRTIIDSGFGDRVMFGSDQMVWPELITKSIEGIENADFLTEDEKRDILCNNAARFLRLDEKICQ